MVVEPGTGRVVGPSVPRTLVGHGRSVPCDRPRFPSASRAAARQRVALGLDAEIVRQLVKPMATEAKEAIWSMGDDTPIAPLATRPRRLTAHPASVLRPGHQPGDRPGARARGDVPAPGDRSSTRPARRRRGGRRHPRRPGPRRRWLGRTARALRRARRHPRRDLARRPRGARAGVRPRTAGTRVRRRGPSRRGADRADRRCPRPAARGDPDHPRGRAGPRRAARRWTPRLDRHGRCVRRLLRRP